MGVEALNSGSNAVALCPAVRSFDAQIEWAEKNIECEEERKGYIQKYIDKKERIERLKGELGCVIDGGLSDTNAAVPRMGLEWSKFANQCPIYKTHKTEINGKIESQS